jgi:peptide/nickel transport system substrate-binding protein
VVALAIAGLVASAQPPMARSAPAGEALRVVLTAEPRSLDPTVDTIKTSLVIGSTMLEPIAINKPDGGFRPHLAEWKAMSAIRWRLSVRKNVKFHNGEPLNADAVVYTVETYLKTRGEARGWFGYLQSAKKVDEYTVDLVTKEPTSYVPATLAFLYVFPPKYYAQVGADGFGQRPVGTGPWQFLEWAKGVQLKVAPNPTYWGRKPAVGEIHFRWAPDASTRAALAETGDVHIAQSIPPALVERLERSSGARIEVVRSMRKAFLRMNLAEGPTADVRVRRALNHAIDVDAIMRGLFRGRAYRFRGFIDEGFDGYQGTQLEAFRYDPDLARRLLAEAGYPNGFETTLLHPVGRYLLDKETAEAIAGQLARVGVRVQLQGLEAGAFFSRVSGERVPGLHFAATAPLFMTPIFHAQVEYQPGLPYAYGANERTGQFLQRAIIEVNQQRLARVLQEFENYVYREHLPHVWLFYYQDIYAASNRVNWKPRSDEFISFDEITFR